MSLPRVRGFFTVPTLNLPCFILSPEAFKAVVAGSHLPARSEPRRVRAYIWKRRDVAGSPVSAAPGPLAGEENSDHQDSSKLPLSFTCWKVGWNCRNTISSVSLLSTGRFYFSDSISQSLQKWQLSQPSCKHVAQSTQKILNVPLNL